MPQRPALLRDPRAVVSLAVLALAVAALLWALARDAAVASGDAVGAFGAGGADAISGGAPTALVDGAKERVEASVGHGAQQRTAAGLSERSGASEKQPDAAPADAATAPFRVRVAAFAEADLDGLELEVARTLESSSIENWYGAVPLERDGPLHIARLPRDLGRRVLLVEVRSRAKDLSSGIVQLGRLLDGEAVLDVRLREVGELLVIVQPPSAASGVTRRSPFDGGRATPPLEVLRLDVLARAAQDEVTTYGARACKVVRAPRRFPSVQHGGELFQRVACGSVRVEVDELRARPAALDGLVRRGERLTLTVPLESLDLVGALSGTVIVEGPAIRNGIYIAVRSLTDPTRNFQAFASGGAGTHHSWRIDDLPAGEYSVVPMPSSFISIDPPTRTVAAPAEALDFVVDNRGETRWFDWHVIDAASRAPLDNVWVDFERRDGTLRSLRLDRAPAERFPSNAEVRWTVRCAGYESRTGTLAECDRADPRAARTDRLELLHEALREVWVCDLELERALD